MTLILLRQRFLFFWIIEKKRRVLLRNRFARKYDGPFSNSSISPLYLHFASITSIKKKTNPNRAFFWPFISNQRTYLTVHELRTDIYWEHTHDTPVTQLSLIYELILRQFSNDQPKKSDSHYCKQLEKKVVCYLFFWTK